MAGSRRSAHAHGRSEVWGRPTLVRAIAAERRRLGLRIRELREQGGLTQERLAELAGLHPKHMPRIEAGVANVTIATLVALARGLGVPLGSFFD